MTADEVLIHARFREIADQADDRIALQTPTANITFTQLARAADHLANTLVDIAQPGCFAILSGDHVVITTSILAVLEAGGCFVPLDANNSDRRLLDLFRTVRFDAVIVDATTKSRVDELGIRVIEMTGTTAAIPEPPIRTPITNDPDSRCSIYFTSGSTGAPRAIAGRLIGIGHHIDWEIATLGLDASVRGAIIHSPGYDAYLPDVLVPICAGGVACAPSERDIVLDPARLCAWLEEQRITLLHCTPTLFRSLLAHPQARRLVALRYVLLAGEVVRHDDLRRARALWGHAVRLFNLYGPTEATLVKLHHELQDSDLELPSIPIGKPMPGVSVHILDDEESSCPVGEVGQIAIQSRFGSLGYVGEPDLTRARFREFPDSREQLYLTGDYGSCLGDGSLLFHGRRDRQVKLCGARIDLDEVETLLCTSTDVHEAAVIVTGDVLHGFVVLSPEGDLRRARAHATSRLSPAARLAWLTPLAELPRTPSGKLDRNRLAIAASGDEP